jgi:hypothetical protein
MLVAEEEGGAETTTLVLGQEDAERAHVHALELERKLLHDGVVVDLLCLGLGCAAAPPVSDSIDASATCDRILEKKYCSFYYVSKRPACNINHLKVACNILSSNPINIHQCQYFLRHSIYIKASRRKISC